MNDEMLEYYQKLKKKGLTPGPEQKILSELQGDQRHEISRMQTDAEDPVSDSFCNVYAYNDLCELQNMSSPQSTYINRLRSIDELLDRDKQREKDGFPRKIQVGRLVKPGKGDKEKIVVVPTTVEEKFLHDKRLKASEDGPSGAGVVH